MCRKDSEVMEQQSACSRARARSKPLNSNRDCDAMPTCGCAACSPSLPSQLSRVGELPAPVLQITTLPRDPADQYDHVFEVALGHYMKVTRNNHNTAMGEAVRFADAFVAATEAETSSPRPTATASATLPRTRTGSQSRGRAQTPAPMTRRSTTPSALKRNVGARGRSSSGVSFDDANPEVIPVPSSEEEDWNRNMAPDRPQMLEPAGHPSVLAPPSVTVPPSVLAPPMGADASTPSRSWSTTSTTTTVCTTVHEQVTGQEGQQDHQGGEHSVGVSAEPGPPRWTTSEPVDALGGSDALASSVVHPGEGPTVPASRNAEELRWQGHRIWLAHRAVAVERDQAFLVNAARMPCKLKLGLTRLYKPPHRAILLDYSLQLTTIS